MNVTIPLDVALLIRGAFVPTNPNKMRKADPRVVAAAKAFIAAVEAEDAKRRGVDAVVHGLRGMALANALKNAT